MFKKIRVFLEQVRVELKKVSWPKKDELIRSTSVVIIMILITATIIGLLDRIFNVVILWLMGVGGGP
jgi:preprotein translocase subunit SecE